ncbi:transcription factor Dp-1-like [Dysidea avara]|uniref:transcription factor Dp-1-like n=1 Tax=Dysidea avara TaxID=196820 RepID=UPI003319D91D
MESCSSSQALLQQSPNHHPAHSNPGLNSNSLGSLGRGVSTAVVGSYLGNGTITPIPRALHLGLSKGVPSQSLSGAGNASLECYGPLSPTSSVNDQSALLSSLWSRKRSRGGSESDDTKRSRLGSVGKGDQRQNKGLRHFSWKVCEKVRQKQSTTYNEVADELVKELSETGELDKGKDALVDHKNIRRRVYDALNVLMAMNIIKKERKEITWIGLPTNSSQECQKIEEELIECQQRIKQKKEEARDLLLQVLSFKNLMKRNKERLVSQGSPAANSAINLPFIIVSTDKKTTIDCSISSDKTEYHFTFDNVFEICDDVQVLKKLGLTLGLDDGTCTPEDLQLAKELMPKSLEGLVDELATPVEEVSHLTMTPTNSPIPNRQIGAISGSSNRDPLSPVIGTSMVYPISPMAAPLSKASPGHPSANSTPNKRIFTTSGSTINPGHTLSSPLNLISRVTGSPIGVKAQVISSDQQPSGSGSTVSSPIAPTIATSKQQMLTAQLAQLMQSNLSPSVLQSLSKIPLGKLNLNSILNSTSSNINERTTATMSNSSDDINGTPSTDS